MHATRLSFAGQQMQLLIIVVIKNLITIDSVSGFDILGISFKKFITMFLRVQLENGNDLVRQTDRKMQKKILLKRLRRGTSTLSHKNSYVLRPFLSSCIVTESLTDILHQAIMYRRNGKILLWTIHLLTYYVSKIFFNVVLKFSILLR